MHLEFECSAERVESAALEFLRTHPLTINRITESAERALAYPDKSEKASDEERLRFRMMKMKSKAAYAEDVVILRDDLASKIANGDSDIATRYGYAIALSRNNEASKARTVIDKLLSQAPANLSLRLLQADIEIEARNINVGLDLMRKLYEEQSPKGNNIFDLYYGNALVLSRNTTLAIPVLKQGIVNSPQEPLFHILLARAYGETGKMYDSFLSRSEFHIMRGNYKFF